MAGTVLDLSVSTQGPAYPPSEIMDKDGNFVTIGRINRAADDGTVTPAWGSALVAADSPLPPFGELAPYRILRELTADDDGMELYTLPLPLPCSNYPMLFAPEQRPDAHEVVRPSYPLHEVPIPDLRAADGPRRRDPITLGQWRRARGQLEVTTTGDGRAAVFEFWFTGLIPDSVYTVMSLRQRDLDPAGPTRPGPLGVPNVFIADAGGAAHYRAELPDPFPDPGLPGANRVVNVVVLWMSYQQNYGGAIGHFGLGADIHAQLKLTGPSFQEFRTRA
ncbi:hypothetical protein [Glycomyces terrestris]|uniref:Uncharacterized protein n=1 Tax=Glycomyces terrestris TaxID=2493553 RepID=A0A426UY79_9ACTN|nr:hypothetical protein [Glycomyces terrestris]RRR99525.1 hypothetical protein EIW28_12535 [Glycomyces terrestris]